MRATYRSGDCWGLTPVEVCIKLSGSDHQTFANLYFSNVATFSTSILSSLVSVDTTHEKKVSSSQTACLTDLRSWMRSQVSRSGRRNVSVRTWEHTTNPYMLPYFIVLTAEVDSGQQQQQKSRERRYSNEDVFMCISKVDCQRHIHTAARVYTYM